MRVKVVGACLFAIAFSLGFSQTTQGLLLGTVTDRDGPVAGVIITSRNVSTGMQRVTKTDSRGQYCLALLSPGAYVLRFQASAGKYQARELHGIEIPVASEVALDIRLDRINEVVRPNDGSQQSVSGGGIVVVSRQYGADIDANRIIEVFNVDAKRSFLEATRSDVIVPRQLEGLPLSGRDTFSLMVTEPGVAADGGTTRSLGLAAGGQRPSASNFLLDGVEFNNSLVTGPLMSLAPESIDEYRISTNNFSAEFGRTPGFLANAVSRSGGTRWHGVAYADLTNNVWDAKRSPHGPNHETEAGLSLGGRISRRFSVWSSFDRLLNRTLEGSFNVNVPSQDLVNYLDQNYALSSTSRHLMDEFTPPASASGSDPFVNHLAIVPPISVDRWLALNRVDYTSEHNRVTARVAIGQLSRPDFIWSPYPEFVSGLKQPSDSILLGIESSIRPNIANETRFSWTVSNVHWDRAHDEIPTLVISGGNPGFENAILPGSQAAFAFRNRVRALELSEGLSWVRQKQLLKVGGGVLERRMEDRVTLGDRGMFEFSDINGFLDDAPATFSGVLSRLALPVYQKPDFSRSFGNRQWFLYAEDRIRISPRLVMSFGIRYDNFGSVVDTGGGTDAVLQLGVGTDLSGRLAGAKLIPAKKLAPLYPADNQNWAPRVGFSWDLFGSAKTTIRGGYGVFYDRPFDNLWESAGSNNLAVAKFVTIKSQTAPTCSQYLKPACPTAVFTKTPVNTDFPDIVAFDPHVRSGYTQNFFVAFQQRVSARWSLEVSGLGALGRRLITTDLINRSFTLSSSLPVSVQTDPTRYNPNLPEILYRAGEGSSRYAALTALFRYRSEKVYYQAAYSLSRSEDNQSDPLTGEYFNLAFSAVGVSVPDRLASFTTQYDSKQDFGKSDFDQRHNLVQILDWSLPNPRGLSRRLLSGWHVSALGVVRSGLPFTVFVPIGTASGALVNNRADIIPGQAVKLSPSRSGSGGEYILNAAAFRPPAPGSVGNSQRNQFAGPGIVSADVSTSRSIRIRWLGENGRIVIRADAYNVLNHLNLGTPNSILGTPTFGLAQYGSALRNSGFPVVTPIQETARRIQLLLRVEF